MQTLKPCPFCGGKAHYTKEIASAGLAAVVMCSDNDCCTNHAGTLQEAVDLWNTRAVAPVDGLERFDLVWSEEPTHHSYVKPDPEGEYVRFDQAETIIAVKDEAVKDAKQSRDDWKKLAKDMQANNAAQHTSIVELEAERSGLEGDIANLEKQLAEAEAKLATANALVTSCCGDPVDAHNMGIGHSPVDQYHYAMMQLEADNVALIARVNGFEGFLDDLAEILGCERDIGDVVNELDAINNRAEALETQLAAARKDAATWEANFKALNAKYAARAVAPVDGLETKAYVRSNGDVVKFRDGWLFDDTEPVVTRSQAEAIIAAERAEKEKWKVRGDQHWDTLRSIREMAREGDCERIILWVNDAGSGYTEPLEATVKSLTDKAVALEANNTALTARVKELSALIDGENCTDPDKIDALFRRAETAETQLATLKDAAKSVEDWWLSEGVNHFPGAPYCIFAIRAALEAKP